MFKNIKIANKIIILVLFLVSLAVLSESFISYHQNKSSVTKHNHTQLQLVSQQFEQKIANYFKETERSLSFIQKDENLTNYLYILNQTPLNDTIKKNQQDLRNLYHKKLFEPFFESFNFHIPALEEIEIVNLDGVTVYQHTNLSISHQKFHTNDNSIINYTENKFTVTDPLKETINDQNFKFYTYVSIPLLNQEKKKIGTLIGKLNTKRFIDALKQEIIAVNKQYEIHTYKMYNSVQVLRIGESSIKPSYFFESISQDPIYLSGKIESGKIDDPEPPGYGEYYNENFNKNYLAAWKQNKLLRMGIMTCISEEDAYFSLRQFFVYTFSVGGFIILCALGLSILFSSLFTKPMLRLKKVLTLISNGVLPKELKRDEKDEIGEMIEIVNRLVDNLKKTAAFAHRIGEGNFNTDYKPTSNKDILGHALVSMRESLQNADKKDALHNWIVTGIAQIGEILRTNDTISTLGDDILNYLCNRINAVQGAFYVLNDDDESDTFIEMKSSYAYQKKKYLTAKIKLAEGLVGQAAVEKDTILRTEIPDNYMNITSGILGEQKPTCILIIPLITNEKVYGIIELASLHKFSSGDVQFMEEVSEIIARTIFNMNVNERTRNLLEKSQRMSSELQVQQEELKRNAIQMESTQEELKHTNNKLEHQIEEVNNAQKRIQGLLENASEVITIYDKDNTIRYVSPSVEHILGYKQEELVGISDIKYVNEKQRPLIEQMFDDLLTNESEQVTIEFSYFRKTGDKVWLEATGKNMLDDPAIQGIVVNSRDITERRRAEREEQKSGQMQALSENSPDLITRISHNGTIFYINPAIQKLTGHSPDFFLNKNIQELTEYDNNSVKEKWLEIVQDVISSRKKSTIEMDFLSEIGERIMTVNAIPEYSSDQPDTIESVLVVSHDITEQKAIEREIITKNKKINDSINYAERIQKAILPDSETIHNVFEESFIYYKPRDVVSGDFPWFMQKGDDVYIAAVDCTGHGVPGALISIVGFFLLNNIVENGQHSHPSEILDALDHAVTTTFKQNSEHSKIKDGMDIGICKVNIKNSTVEYSGAHRPLYVLHSEGEITEIKGNKFPIGGGNAYTNKTSFDNHVLEMKPNESIYFSSDGYPDQFGGPKNRKFGPKRMKQLLSDSADKNIVEIHNEFDQQFMTWKGETKQTDDVLLIGIRF